MEQLSFKTGDLVRLKSGGPPMIVLENERLNSVECVECGWFDVYGELHKEVFVPLVLEPTQIMARMEFPGWGPHSRIAEHRMMALYQLAFGNPAYPGFLDWPDYPDYQTAPAQQAPS